MRKHIVSIIVILGFALLLRSSPVTGQPVIYGLDVVHLPADPTVGAGYHARLGALGVRDGTSTLYVKGTLANTGWTRIDGGGGATGDITAVVVTSPACPAGNFMATLTGGATSGSAPVGGACAAEVGDVSGVVVTNPACGAGAAMTSLTGGATSGSVPVGGGCTTLTVSSAKVTLHGARAVGTVATSAVTSTHTAALWNSEWYDTDAFHDVASLTNRITVPAGMAGYYRLSCNLIFAANGTGTRVVSIRVNAGGTASAGTIIGQSSSPALAAGTTDLTASGTVGLIVGDEVQCTGWQSSGGALNITNGASPAHFSATLLGT